MIPSIGIDLGTTYSSVARLGSHGELVSVLNAEGDRSTPSVVLFEDDEVIVGKEALKALSTDAESVAQCSKRFIGEGTFPQKFNDQHYAPETIEAWILDKLYRDSIEKIGPFEKVVITVPAYFDEVRRKATQDAGYMAGLDVIDIINEPTAAAVAFGYEHGVFGASSASNENQRGKTQRILIYDLGGGTFDVTVMEINGSDFVTLSTNGDTGLGGYDWDQYLVNMVAEKFLEANPLVEDPREDPNISAKLWRDCEDAKRTLSSRKKASVPCDYKGSSSLLEITREQFEEATQELLGVTQFTTEQTIREAGFELADVDTVLLVGGSSRMPMVRKMLRELFGREPNASVSADEAVAFGAALHANSLLTSSQGQPASFKIHNVNSHSLGVVGTDPATKLKRNAIVLPRNTRLPVSKKRTFKTQEFNQENIFIQVLEGESSSPDDCSQIGQFTISHLPPMPTGSPVDVWFNYQANGLLNVQVSIPNTQRVEQAEFTRENRLTKDLLDAWRQRISGKPPTDYE